MGVQMFPHGGVVSEHLGAAFVWAGDGPRHLVKSLLLGFDPADRDEQSVGLTGRDQSYYRAKSANCFGSERSSPGIPPTGIFFPVMYSV